MPRQEGTGAPIGRLIPFRVLLTLVIAGLAGPAPGLAAGVPPPWREAARDRKPAEAALLRERVASVCEDLTPVARELLRAAAGEDDPEVALGLRHLAASAAPSDPRPQWALVPGLLGQGRWVEAAGRAARGAANALSDPWLLGQGGARALLVLALAGWITGGALLAWGLAARGSQLFHDYADVFPWRLRRWTPAGFALVLGAAAWTAGLGPAPIAAALSVALAPYLPPRGRAVLAASVLLAFSLPLALSCGSFRRDGAGRAWSLYLLEKGAGPREMTPLLTGLTPGSQEALFARHAVARRAGRWDEAVAAGRSALESGGDPWFWHLHLGNLFFLRGDYGKAEPHYRAAAAARPDDPLAWFNLHLVHLARLELSLADDALDRARALDRRAVERLAFQLPSGGGGAVPATPPFPSGWIVAELLRPQSGPSGWGARGSGWLFWPWRRLPAWPAGVLALVLVLGSARVGRERRSHRCPACGAVVCPRCSYRVKGSLLCAACWAAERDPDADVSEQARVREAGRRWRSRAEAWSRVGAATLPGWASYLGAGSPRSLVLGIAWSLSAAVAAVWSLVPAPGLPWGGDRAVVWAALLALAGAHAAGLAGAARGRGGGR